MSYMRVPALLALSVISCLAFGQSSSNPVHMTRQSASLTIQMEENVQHAQELMENELAIDRRFTSGRRDYVQVQVRPGRSIQIDFDLKEHSALHGYLKAAPVWNLTFGPSVSQIGVFSEVEFQVFAYSPVLTNLSLAKEAGYYNANKSQQSTWELIVPSPTTAARRRFMNRVEELFEGYVVERNSDSIAIVVHQKRNGTPDVADSKLRQLTEIRSDYNVLDLSKRVTIRQVVTNWTHVDGSNPFTDAITALNNTLMSPTLYGVYDYSCGRALKKR